MNKTVYKRSIQLKGKSCSISLEDEFWNEVVTIAAARGLFIRALISEIDAGKSAGQNLSSAVRVFVLQQYYTDAGQHSTDIASSLEM